MPPSWCDLALCFDEKFFCLRLGGEISASVLPPFWWEFCMPPSWCDLALCSGENHHCLLGGEISASILPLFWCDLAFHFLASVFLASVLVEEFGLSFASVLVRVTFASVLVVKSRPPFCLRFGESLFCLRLGGDISASVLPPSR